MRDAVTARFVAAALFAVLAGGPLAAQQGFQDPFSKTGFHAGDLYSSIGNSSIDAVSGRAVYQIPVAKLPRNGKLPQALTLYYNSNYRETDKAIIPINSVTPISRIYMRPNQASSFALGWRLSMGTLVLASDRGMLFIDPSGAEHSLRHTNGCPPLGCPTGWAANDPSVNEMQPGVHRSADGQFYQANVSWTPTTANPNPKVDNITRVEVHSADGLTYIFDEFLANEKVNNDLQPYLPTATKIGEVKRIVDPDGNQLNFTYDNSIAGSRWSLVRIDDGIRPITLDYQYTSYSDLTLDQLMSQQLVKGCVEYGMADMRSCREGAAIPGSTVPSTCTTPSTVAAPGGIDPGIDPGPATPPTYSGRLLNGVTISYAGEAGKMQIQTETRKLCRTVIGDHYYALENLPPFATVIIRVDLNQTIATLGNVIPITKAGYRFNYLPDGMLWKVINPLGASEEFRWTVYAPIHWDDIAVAGSCKLPESPRLIAFDDLTCTFTVQCAQLPGPTNAPPTFNCEAIPSCDSGGGTGSIGGINASTGGVVTGSSVCTPGTTLQMTCEHFDAAPTNPTHNCGPIPPYQPTTLTPTPYEDPDCICTKWVYKQSSVSSTCAIVDSEFEAPRYGVQQRIVRENPQGTPFIWRYDRKFDDTYTTPPAGTRSYQDRRFVEVTNPDGTRERLFFYESSNYLCSLASEANKQGMPSAREVLDSQGNLLMREDYEYAGFPMAGTVRHEMTGPRANKSPYWDLARLHADFFRIATTTRYYKPHTKSGLMVEDASGESRLRLSTTDAVDDYRTYLWNGTLPGASSFTASSGANFTDLPPASAEDYVNAVVDDGNVLYAHRSEESDYVNLGHFGKARECDVTQLVYQAYVAGIGSTRIFKYICQGDPPPELPTGMLNPPTVTPLPGIGGLLPKTRTWWNGDINPATNPDRAAWTIHQPVESFLTDSSGKVFSASMNRYQNGKPAQTRAAELTQGVCTTIDTAFAKRNDDGTVTKAPVPTDLLLACTGTTPRQQDSDLIDRRSYDTNGNLNRQEIARGAQATFSDNSAGILNSSFALNFSWLNGAPVASQFSGFSYQNQNRTVNALTGVVDSERDANGKQTAYAYDNLLRITSITPPDGEAPSTIAYPTMNDAMLTKGDTQLTYAYDGLGRVWKESKKMADGTFSSRFTGYDYAGRQSFKGEWIADNDPRASGFDPRQNRFECGLMGAISANPAPVASLGAPLGDTRLATATSTTTPFPGTWTCYDALGRPERIIAADGATTQYLYLGVDSVVRVFKNTDLGGHPAPSPDDQVTKYYHDAYGRLMMVDTDCAVKSFEPFVSGLTGRIPNENYLVCDETQPGQGADAVYFYDLAGRLTTVNLVKQLPVDPRTAYLAVQSSPRTLLAASPFGLGQLRTFDYDSLGRLKRACNPENGCVDYFEYDALGNVLEVQDENGKGSKPLSSGSTAVNPFCDSTIVPAPNLDPVAISSQTPAACTPTQPFSCIQPAASVSFTWGPDGLTNRMRTCLAPSYSATLTGPVGSNFSKTLTCTEILNPDGSIQTGCPGATFALPASVYGKYTLNVTVAAFNSGTNSRTLEFGIAPSPPTISITAGPGATVSGPEASLSWVAQYAPACVTDAAGTHCPFVTASVTTGSINATPFPGVDPTAPLPLSGSLTLAPLFGKNLQYTVTLTLKDMNGVQLDQAVKIFTVSRNGNYSLRYAYDGQGRLRGVSRFDVATGASTPLTEVGYDNYARLGGLYAPGAGLYPNAPLGKKTWTLSHQRGLFSFIDATDYTEMGGRAARRSLVVNDGFSPASYSAATSYTLLGLPSTLQYPGRVGAPLTANSVYAAGWLQGLSGNTDDTGLQRNYLTGLTFNPAGTLAGFNLGTAASTTMSYDLRNRPTGITNRAGAIAFPSGLYQYDGAGNITNIGAQSFAYDRLNRLTHAHVTRTLANAATQGSQDVDYAYDLFGNMTRKYSQSGTLAAVWDNTDPFIKSLTFGAPSGPARDYTLGGDGYLAALGYDPSRIPNPESRISNRINEAGYVYDANGNLIADPKFCYDYDELNRMIAARPKDSAGVCAAQPAADYFYDADNLRSIKRLWSAGGTQPLSFTTTVRGGLDGLSDITTHVSDGLETKSPYEQKNYVYGPGGLIASEKRVLYANSNPAWQIYGASTGCAVNNPAATAEALASNGYDLLLNFGACFSATVQSMVLEWHELNADGTPKDCTNQRTDATTNFNARYNCGLLHLNPATGTARLYKLKYASTSYDVKVTENVEMGLYGTKTFVVSRFTASLAKGQPATALAYADQTPAPPAPGASLGAPGPGGREVNYYQKDHLGTIRVVSDENGNVLSTHDYEPFGLELPSQDFSFNTHRFTGHERDTETGLDYMKARYFGASMGRFAAVDPTIRSIKSSAPDTWNRYSYVNNAPTYLYDLTGEDGQDGDRDASGDYCFFSCFVEHVKNFPKNVKEWFSIKDKSGSLTSASVGGNGGSVSSSAGGSFGSRLQSGLADAGQETGNNAVELGNDALLVAGAFDAAALIENLPKLVEGSGTNMFREAREILAKSTGSAETKGNLFEALAKQIAERTGNSWQATRLSGADGSVIFKGESQARVLVISPSGEVFTGQALGGVQATPGGGLQPVYDALTKIEVNP